MLSTALKTLLVLALLAGSGFGVDFDRPVKGKVDLSSNFCEFRPGHFHGGIDIRTGGKEGRPVYSPTDGFVWRLKFSYIGYGKAVYVKDYQGFIYVFGHLSRLSDRLDTIAKSHQYQTEAYSFDNFYDRDSIPVKRGELIAYTGQSGFGAPHLHFEIRNGDNMPLNPLTNGFDLGDPVPPRLDKVAFIYLDSASLFNNGRRRLSLNPVYDKTRKKYLLQDVVPVTGSFGIMARVYDRLRRNGPTLNIYRARLFIDDYLYYENRYEQYDYAETHMVDLCFDYPRLVNNEQDWHLLYIPDGQEFSGSKSLYNRGGVFEKKGQLDYGRHTARTEFYDAAGNLTELEFDFVMIPDGPLIEPVRINDSTLFLQDNPDSRYLDIGEIIVYGLYGKGGWRQLASRAVTDGRLADPELIIPSGRTRPSGLKIELRGNSGWSLTDHIVTLEPPSGNRFEITYDLVDGGLLLNIKANHRLAETPRVVLHYADGFHQTLVPRRLEADRLGLFFRPDNIRSDLIRIEMLASPDDIVLGNLDLRLGHADRRMFTTRYGAGGDFEMVFDGDNFYYPAFFEVAAVTAALPHNNDIVGKAYTIGPRNLPLKGTIEVSFNDSRTDAGLGLYRLNDKNKWKWLDPVREGAGIAGRTGLTGTYARIKDNRAPRVKGIYPPDGKTVFTGNPEIRCTIRDNLSGIDNDEQVSIFLDGRWLIPEYDPETEILKTYPDRNLANGRHDLKITVSDRAGNSRTVATHFFVNKSGKKN